MKYSRYIIDGLAFCALAGLLFFAVKLSLQKESEPPHVQQIKLMKEGEIDFSFVNLEDKKNQNLSDFRGRSVLVNIWASWCLPCVEELPSLVKLAEASSDLVIIAVTEEDEEVVESFLDTSLELKKNKNFIVALSREVSETFFPKALPETYIFDKKGRFSLKVIGPRNWNSSEWKNKIDQISSL